MRGGTAKSRPHKRWRASGDDDARAIRVSAPPYAHAWTYAWVCGQQLCSCCETQTRTLSGPPSTGASIAMDGGVADTPCN